MKKDILYKSNISDARWMIYDVPGNVGWILYLVCLVQCFVKRPAFMEILLVRISAAVGILPAIILLLLAVGGVLCALFAGLIFKTFRPQRIEE